MENKVKVERNGLNTSRINKIRILNLIRREKEISRAEIVKRTGISAPTVTRVADSLLHCEKLIEQTGMGESSGGRPPLMVRFLGEENYVIGIDWGKTHIYGILANLDGKVLYELDIPSEVDNDFESDLKKVSNLIDYIIQNSGANPQKILGIGIAAAGYINKTTGEIQYSPNFKWKHTNIKPSLEKDFGVQVKVDNVARVTALGELLYGVGSSFENFIYINVGYGIGSGIIINGEPHYGFDGYSGEVGHTRIAINHNERRKCVCGKENCLECYSSGRGITETVLEKYDKTPDSILHILCNGNKNLITAEMIARAARSGDKISKEAYSLASEILGYSIANMANVFNPEAIILGGKVLKAGDLFLGKVKEVFHQETIRNVNRKIPVLRSENMERGTAIGAVSLILKEVLELGHVQPNSGKLL